MTAKKTTAKKTAQIALDAILTKSLDQRFEYAKQDENNNQMRFFMTLKKNYALQSAFFASCEKAQKNGVSLETLQSVFGMIEKNKTKGHDSAFLAQYAVEKVCKMIRAQDDLRALDPYSSAIIANALLQAGKISSKGALRSLCNKIEIDAFDESELIRYCAKVEVTTASTQRSSTREALRVLGLANCNKGKKNDPVELTENGKTFFAFLLK